MNLSKLTLAKISTIVLILLVLFFSEIKKKDTSNFIPPLTVAHTFSNCPFKLELPGKTSGANRRNRETAEYIDENFLISAGCSTYLSEKSAMLSPDYIAKDFLNRRMGLRIYKNYKIVPLHLQSNTAQIRYEAVLQLNENSEKAYGIIHVVDNFVLDIEVVGKSGNFDIETLNPLFQSVDYIHSD